jgi:hypothetical protein
MPLNYAFIGNESIIAITGDHATPTELAHLLAKITRDSRCVGRECAILRDRRQTSEPVNVPAILGTVDVIRQFWAEGKLGRIAVVMREGDDIPAQLAEALADSRQIPWRAFSSYDAALEWLREGLRTSA